MSESQKAMTSVDVEADVKTPLMDQSSKLTVDSAHQGNSSDVRANSVEIAIREPSWSLSYVDFVPGLAEAASCKTFR